MRVQLVAWAVLFVSWLMGCAAQVPTAQLSDSTSRELRQNMKIYSPAQLNEAFVDRLGVVSAISCKGSFWESASEQAAVDPVATAPGDQIGAPPTRLSDNAAYVD